MTGFLLVDKPSGWTSHDVVAKIRRLSGVKKVGHAGTLDPMATGLLVVAVGPVTRLLRFLQDLTKTYIAEATFGIATDSLDADGEITEKAPMAFDRRQLEEAVSTFVGDIEQIPPMVSAVKVGGKKLYELAREGKEIERDARPVTIHQFEVLGFEPGEYPTASFRIQSSKGTYVRTLVDDVARRLGGRAHLTALRRTTNGSLSVADAATIELLEADGVDGHLVDPARALADLPSFTIGAEDAAALRHGRQVRIPDTFDGSVAAIGLDGDLIAVGEPERGWFKSRVVLR
ncbi:MAG: tRNA pseudouridine(55) synthase TruB [Acidimicrobiia bacterium]|nr:tRNA pseudouridine(55) synthase TruB [Acidimicrobiia bacterium]